MRIATRSIFKEIALHWLMIMTLLLVIMFTTQLGRYLGKAADGDLPVSVLLSALGLRSVHYVVYLFAPALFFSVLMALGRLYRDNEMAAWLACGLKPKNIIIPVLAIAFFLAGIAGLVSLYLDPLAEQSRLQLEAEAKSKAKLTLLEPGKFRSINDGQAIVYVGNVGEDGSTVSNVFIHANLAPEQAFIEGQLNPSFTLSAASGYQRENPVTGVRELVLKDGRRLEGVVGQGSWQIADFSEHGLNFAIENKQAVIDARRSAMTTVQLVKSGYENNDLQNLVEFYTRLGVPLAMPLLALLAIPLAKSGPRESRWGRLIVGVLSYMAFYSLLTAALKWTEKGLLPPWLGPWWVYAALCVFVGVLFWQQFGTRKTKLKN